MVMFRDCESIIMQLAHMLSMSRDFSLCHHVHNGSEACQWVLGYSVPLNLHLMLRLTMGDAVFPVGIGVWCAFLSPSSAEVDNG
jgi:hypothetical protein